MSHVVYFVEHYGRKMMTMKESTRAGVCVVERDQRFQLKSDKSLCRT